MSHELQAGRGASRPRVLLLDERPLLRSWLEAGLGSHCELVSRADGDTEPPAAVVLDVDGRDPGQLALLRDARARWPESELVVIASRASVQGAVACLRAGAAEYLEESSAEGTTAVEALERALERQRLRSPALPDCPGVLDGIVALSPGMRSLVRTVRALADSDSNVLIEAESGTGKELLARAIHDTSPRARGAFVPVDCGALPEGIAERELFGHERGAFTGAHRSAPGLFRSAHGGTLFLDEVGELSLPLQAKLLRALQQREVRPLGATAALAVDVRIVAATNRDLAAEVRAARFRADLFYRLRVVSLSIPPLRERPEDVPALAGRFLALASRGGRIQGFEPEVLEALQRHSWDGNVRELQNAIEAAAALARGPLIGLSDLRLGGARAPLRPAPRDLPLALDAYEAACLREVLSHAAGDVAAAARILGIGRSTLYRKLARHGLTTEVDRRRSARRPALGRGARARR
jgi:two-component system response regulator HydG